MKSAPAWVGLRKSPFRRIRNSIQSNWVNTIRQYLFLETGDFAASIDWGNWKPIGNYARFQCFLHFSICINLNPTLSNFGTTDFPSLKLQSSSILHNDFLWCKYLIVLHWEMGSSDVLSWNDWTSFEWKVFILVLLKEPDGKLVDVSIRSSYVVSWFRWLVMERLASLSIVVSSFLNALNDLDDAGFQICPLG
jgi:hypothetical protein